MIRRCTVPQGDAKEPKLTNVTMPFPAAYDLVESRANSSVSFSLPGSLRFIIFRCAECDTLHVRRLP